MSGWLVIHIPSDQEVLQDGYYRLKIIPGLGENGCLTPGQIQDAATAFVEDEGTSRLAVIPLGAGHVSYYTARHYFTSAVKPA